MKICQYCKTKTTHDVLQCDSCGSKEFKNICDNCEAEFVGKTCPACGVMLGEKPRLCYNCGKRTFATVCPACGADLINGADYFDPSMYEPESSSTYTVTSTKTFVNSTPGSMSGSTPDSADQVLSEIISDFSSDPNTQPIAQYISEFMSEPNTTTYTTTVSRTGPRPVRQTAPRPVRQTAPRPVRQTASRPAPQNNIQAQPKKTNGCGVAIIITLIFAFIIGIFAVVFINLESSRLETLSKKSYAMELFALKGHPKLYEDIDKAKIFWEEKSDVSVIKGKKSSFNKVPLLLVSTDDENSNVIRNITISITDKKCAQAIKLDDMIGAICGYIPYDIIDEYYTFRESFVDIRILGGRETYYCIMDLNDKGKAANKTGKKYLDIFSIQITRTGDGDSWYAEIHNSSGVILHEKYPNEFKKEKWAVELKR